MKHSSPSPEEIRRIGPYRLEEKLGAGGMGAVYRAFDERLERAVALKQILPKVLDSPRAARRFRREARAAARLSHPGIVKVHDLLEAEGCDWIVMELVEGKTLAQLLKPGPLALERVLPIAAEIAEALAAAHAEGIVHRDLKARNVLVTAEGDAPGRTAPGRTKILDFGLAKQVLYRDGKSTSISVDGQLLGTPQAMSPEQAMGRKVDLRSDLFSLGSLLYEMVTGVAPFRADNPLETITRVCTSHPPSIRERLPGSAQRLSDLIDRLLEKDPAHRPQTAGEVALELRRIADDPLVGESPADAAVTVGGDAPLAAPTLGVHRSRSERRQVTVLCCELVSAEASSSGSLDPEAVYTATAELERLAREVAERFGGHVAHVLGHRLVVYFGFPLAHEDDARRALHAALKLMAHREALAARSRHQEAPELGLRVGIHTGPAVTVAGGPQQGQVAAGSTLDLAIALQRLAEPNQVLVSGATRRLVATACSAEALDPVEVDGFPEPLPIFRIREAKDASSHWQIADRLTPFIARERELELLLDRFQRVREGAGQVVLLSGEAGIGKSRLLHTLGQRLAADASWLIAYGSSYAPNSALHPIIELLRRFLRLDPDDAPDEQLDRLEQELSRLGVTADDAVPLFAVLLGLPFEGRHSPINLSPQRQREKTLRVLAALFLEMARRRPLVLVVEDLQWVDPSTLELLSLLIEQTAAASLLLLLSFRPQFEAPWGVPAHLTQLNLSRLAGPEVAALIDRVAAGRVLPDEVRAQIVARTDGVPLFVEELTKSLLESDLLIEKHGRCELAGSLADLAVPATLRDSLTARLDRLGAAKEVAQLAATVGREFSYDLLSAVSPLAAPALERELDSLVASELVYRKGFSARRRYFFKHAMIQDAAYDSLLKRQRQAYHEKIAHAFEGRFAERAAVRPELLGHHWAMAGCPDQAVPYLTRAGDRSKAAYANDEAITSYRRAIRLSEEAGETDRSPAWLDASAYLYESISDIMILTRRFEEAEQANRTALQLARAPGARARLHRKIGCALELQTREDEALEELNTAEAALGRVGDGASDEDWHEWIRIQLAKSSVVYRQDRLDEMAALAAKLGPIVTLHGSLALRADFLEMKVRLNLKRERYQPSAETAENARSYLATCEEIGDKSRITEAWSCVGFVQLFRNELAAAGEALHKSLDLARQIGDVNMAGMCLAYLSMVARKSGQVAETRRLSSEIMTRNVRVEYHGLAEGNLAWVAWRAGDLAETEARGAAALACWREANMSYPFQWPALFPLLATKSTQGELPEAVELVRLLLDPSQMRLVERLEALLGQSMEKWKANRSEDTVRLIVEALRNAEQSAYL